MTTTTVQKWGNSQAVRLPKSLLDQCKIAPGAICIPKKVGKTIVLTFVQPKKKSVKKRETLQELVARITLENRHELLYKGAAVGKEIW